MLPAPLLPLFLLLPLPLQEDLAGTWEGAIGDGDLAVRTVLHLGHDAEGALRGTVDSPEQGAFGLAVDELRLTGRALSFRVPDTQGSWSGEVDEAGTTLTGTWSQRGAELELVLERVEVDPLVGTWEGTGDFGGLELRLVFHVGTHADGSFGASMVSPDQSTRSVPVARVEVQEDGSVRFELPSIGAVWEGRHLRGEARLEGHLTQGGGRFQVDLVRGTGPAPRRRPQTPRPPFPYTVEEVEYDNPVGKSQLAGTVTRPAEGGPFPAVLLITGSGSQDRDEELFGHRPFLVIADHLTRAGLLVLRVDDRGVGGSTGDVANATSLDLATDVSAGVDYLRGRADVRRDAIGLLGHSEGGLIAPLVATEREDVAFLVLLAGTGIPGDELLYLQAALLARAAGADEAGIAANRALQEELFDVLRSDLEDAELREAVLEVCRKLGDEETARTNAAQFGSPWFRFFVNHDPAPVLREVRCPVLAVNGKLDLQVPWKENLEAIAAALEEGGNEDWQTRSYAGLNHLFQHAEVGSVPEYAQLEETFAPEVLEDLTAWILARVGEE